MFKSRCFSKDSIKRISVFDFRIRLCSCLCPVKPAVLSKKGRNFELEMKWQRWSLGLWTGAIIVTQNWLKNTYCYHNSKSIPLQKLRLRLFATWFVIKSKSSVWGKILVSPPGVRRSSSWIKLPFFEWSEVLLAMWVRKSHVISVLWIISRIKVDAVEVIVETVSYLPLLFSTLQKRKTR